MQRRVRAALVALSVAALAGCSAGATAPSATSSGTPATSDPGGGGSPSLLVIGDSYAAGFGADAEDTSFAWQLGRALGAETSVDAVGGSGFVSLGPDSVDQRFGTRLAATSEADLASTVVVVQGGLNDRWFPPGDVRAATEDFLAELEARAPGAVIVLVGAPAPVPTSPGDSVAVNTVLARAAAGFDITFVSPIGTDWFTEANVADYVASDRLHPTQAGHDFLARRLAEIVAPLLED